MKLLIGGKSRNIYMRKDGSAYYKSGGQQVDITHMFKKNGGGLKKQYIGGVEGNLAKVEKNKRSNKCAKQILGGVGDGISFDPIKVESEKLVKADNEINEELARVELEKLCFIALNGLSIKSNKLQPNDSKDKIKISITRPEQFTNYVDNNIAEATKTTIYGAPNPADHSAKFAKINEDFKKQDAASELKKLGFTGIDLNAGITVTRAYVLNKVLQCFEGADSLAGMNLDEENKSQHPINVLTNKNPIINPQTGDFVDAVNFPQILDNIVSALKLNPDELKIRVRNLHTILFDYEKIGAPPLADGAAVADDPDPE